MADDADDFEVDFSGHGESDDDAARDDAEIPLVSDDDRLVAKRRRDAENARRRRAERRRAREASRVEATRDADTTRTNVVALPLKVAAGAAFDDHISMIAVLARRVYDDVALSDGHKLRLLVSATPSFRLAVEVREIREAIERIERHLGVGRFERRRGSA